MTASARSPYRVYILFGWTIGRSCGTAPTRSISAKTIQSGTFPLKEIEDVLADPDRIEVHLTERQAYRVVGRTANGRWLVVIWIDVPEGRYPIHARQASERVIRRLTEG